MRIELICEQCGRPGKLLKQTTGRTANGHLIKDKKINNVCDCGGKVKPLHA